MSMPLEVRVIQHQVVVLDPGKERVQGERALAGRPEPRRCRTKYGIKFVIEGLEGEVERGDGLA